LQVILSILLRDLTVNNNLNNLLEIKKMLMFFIPMAILINLTALPMVQLLVLQTIIRLIILLMDMITLDMGETNVLQKIQMEVIL
jgi:hypothetical protein